MEHQLRNAGITAERICAIDGLAVAEDLRDYFFENGRLVSALKPGEVGCYASHLKALRTILARDLEYALILEDDALLPHDLTTVIEDVLASVPESWDFIHLCGEPRRAVKPVAPLKHRGTLVRYSRIPGGTVGYLISRKGARKFLTPSKRAWPIDTDFRRPWVFRLDAYGVVPKMIDHSEALASPIQALGGRARRRRGLPRPSRHAWTGNPLHCPEGVYHNIKTLGALWWATCWWRNVRVRFNNLVGAGDPSRQPASAALTPTSRPT
jgi:glycosyl transferase family 25